MKEKTFYILIGTAASLLMFTASYYVLSLDSSIGTLIATTKNSLVYLYLYTIFSISTIVLFGINAALFAKKIKSSVKLSFKESLSHSTGSFAGILASACPACGSTLLSLIGITGGLAAFPFEGLEIKALSFGLMSIPLILKTRKKCENNSCENVTEKNEEIKNNALELIESEDAKKELNKTELNQTEKLTKNINSANKTALHWNIFLILLISLLIKFNLEIAKTDPAFAEFFNNNSLIASPLNIEKEFTEISEKVIPKKGFKSKIILKNSIVKMADYGIIDKEKFLKLYENRGGVPENFKNILNEPSNEKIILNEENAYIYVNLLWPLGLSNYLKENESSPVNGKDLFNFASTGGWTLGKEKNGGSYFNKFKIVELTPEQASLAVQVAKNIYRPCCGNSTFFQDCNHGSALLGLLELGAGQGLSEDELYKEALAFNSYWFSDTYIKIAVYFEKILEIKWEHADAKLILGKEYSSSRGFRNNVLKILQEKNLLPEQKGGGGCGV